MGIGILHVDQATCHKAVPMVSNAVLFCTWKACTLRTCSDVASTYEKDLLALELPCNDQPSAGTDLCIPLAYGRHR